MRSDDTFLHQVLPQAFDLIVAHGTTFFDHPAGTFQIHWFVSCICVFLIRRESGHRAERKKPAVQSAWSDDPQHG